VAGASLAALPALAGVMGTNNKQSHLIDARASPWKRSLYLSLGPMNVFFVFDKCPSGLLIGRGVRIL
jgi:hypothetical protein